MNKSQYNPESRNPSSPKPRPAGRRSIRLKSHDYAGGGLYFVTLCAHREFIQAAKGKPFGESGARQVSPERELIEERMRITAEKAPFMKWEEAVIMPDHFHALIRMEGGHLRLGDIIGGFKSAVSRELRRRSTGEACLAPACLAPACLAPACLAPARLAPAMRIWHRNYYEMIVRTPEAEKNIRRYIQMNPWRCVQQFGNDLRGMGNPSLWNLPRLGILCSHKGDMHVAPTSIPNADVYLSGFHSPMEKEIFTKLLELKKPIIWCPAWGLERAAFAPGVREALEENRILILEMRNLDGDLAAAEQRNRFVLEQAEKRWLPHVTRGGMIDRLLRETDSERKRFNH